MKIKPRQGFLVMLVVVVVVVVIVVVTMIEMMVGVENSILHQTFD